MPLDRTKVLAAALLFATVVLPVPLHAQSAANRYPDHAIRLVVPFPAGGINDVLARVWANKVTPHLGTIVIENRGGGGSMLGSAEIAHAPPDGYSLLLGNTTIQILNPALMRAPPFNPAKDFIAVTILTTIPSVIAVHPSLPVNNLKELADYARANPGKLSFGSAGVGTMTHLSGELFKKLAGGLDIVHVPYRGGAPGMSDITSGNVPVISLSMAAQVLELHRAGKIRVLCVNSPTRLEVASDIPTAVESGFPALVIQTFNGIFAPAGTPAAIVDRIAIATKKVMLDGELQKVLKSAGAEIVTNSDSAVATRFVAAERERWAPIIKASGMEMR